MTLSFDLSLMKAKPLHTLCQKDLLEDVQSLESESRPWIEQGVH